MASTAALELLIKLDGANKAGQELDDLGKKGGGLGDVFKTGAMIAGGAILGLGAALIGATAAAAEEEKGIARLNNTLKNAIPNWDGNTQAVEAYITKQEQLGFADDQLRDSLNFLVRQTGSLTEAQELQTTAMDLARSANIDLATATKAVGKVDQDSIGILKKLGIQVTENMTKEEALTAIRAKSAGASEAYANTTAGAMERIQNTFSNVIETIGGAVLPLISGPLQAFADWFQSPEVQAGIQAVATLIGETLVGAFQFFQNAINMIMPIIQPFVDAIVGFFSSIASGGDLMAALGVYFDNFGAAVTNAWNIVAPALGTLLGNIVQWVIDNGPTILANLLTWATAFGTWIWNDALPLVLAELGKLISAVWTWITDNGPSILAQLGTWATQFWQWVVDVTPTVLAELGKLVSSVWAWIVAEGPGILLQLGQWALAFIGWIVPMLPTLALELGKILLEITKWILFTALPGVIVELVKLGAAFLNWIAKDVLPKLGEELGKIWSAITGWFAEILGLTPAQAKPVGEAAAKGIGTGFTVQWTSVQDDCVKAYCGLPAACEAGIKADIYDTGCFAATGIADGFCNQWVQTEQDRCVAVLCDLPSALNSSIGARSPAKLFMPIGEYAAEGIGTGFTEAWTGVSAAIGVTVTSLATTVKDMFDVVAVGWSGTAAAIGEAATSIKTKVLDDFDQLATGFAGIAVGIGLTATNLTQKILDESDRMATGWSGTSTAIGVIAGNIETDIHALATAFAADMAAMTAAYNAMKARLESGVTVGTTTVYNGSNGIPAGAGSGGPMGGGTPGQGRGVLGSTRAGGIVGGGTPGTSTSITIGPITIYAGLGANGQDIADGLVDEIENRLGQRIFTRNPGLVSLG